MVTRVPGTLTKMRLGNIIQSDRKISRQPAFPLFYSTVLKYPSKNLPYSLFSLGFGHNCSCTFSTTAVLTESNIFSSCWKCNYNMSNSKFSLVCPKCQSLQKISTKNLPNYYDLLDQPKTYRVDLVGLSSQVKQLQKKLHPDLFTQKGEEEQQMSQELSSFVNKAFATLHDPIERGHYLLLLQGMDVSSDLEKQLTLDPEFLEDVMELNERLEEITDEKKWLEFRDQNDNKLKELQKELEKLFDEQKVNEAQIILSRMKYFDSLQHRLKELQSRIGLIE